MVPWIISLIRYLLRVPLLYKILLANCITVALLALAGAVLAIRHVRTLPTDVDNELIVLFLIISVAIIFVVNFLVMKLVLAPLNHLEEALDDASQEKQPLLAPGLVTDEHIDRLWAGYRNMKGALQEKASRVQLLSHEVLYAQEIERKRIARELHDEVSQTLTSVLLYLKLLENTSGPAEAQRLQNLRQLITHALGDIRKLAVDLHPKILDEWGLEAALGQRVDELNTDGSRLVILQVAGRSSERLPKELEYTFYHVAQEALNNVSQHSHAHSAQVSLKQEAECLMLEVQDDGVGFNSDAMKAESPRSFGLASIRQRLDLVNGELTIESRPGCGTRLCARAHISSTPSVKGNPIGVQKQAGAGVDFRV